MDASVFNGLDLLALVTIVLGLAWVIQTHIDENNEEDN